ncbi:hypothetical protein [Sphingobium sp. D43FB]|uniref:hypothetical protein n=1 Tax=Sphingobium sp. D43FB TaxID=2017595 RepID=UPI000BB562CF|nr:hypothetical protein [Sphingobium sp. D43FB]PBN41343.1 hypothetical protein SxD43FB_22295 [Sphingobium sp. D43FB]
MFPFHSESERDWFAWSGLLISTWSATELSLGSLIDFVYRFCDGQTVEAEPPLNLERRIKFLQRAAGKLPKLAGEKDEIVALMDALRKASEFRHMTVHGTDRNIYKADPHFAYLSKPKDRKIPDGQHITMRVTQEQIEAQYHEVGLMGLCILGCMSRLMSNLENEMALLHNS